MAADMLSAYYSRGCSSGELFSGREAEAGKDFRLHLNQHHVIRLDVQQFLESERDLRTFIAEMERTVVNELTEVFPEGKELGTSPRLKTALNIIFTQTGKDLCLLLMNGTVYSVSPMAGKTCRKNIWIFSGDFLKGRIMWTLPT